jgi:hypothetical protein
MMNARMNAEYVAELVSKVAPGTRVAPAPSLDPEKVSIASAYNLLAKTIEEADRLEKELGATRTGPRDLFIDVEPGFKGSANRNYESVWAD